MGRVAKPGREGTVLICNRAGGANFSGERGQVGRPSGAGWVTIGFSKIGGTDVIAPSPGDSHG